MSQGFTTAHTGDVCPGLSGSGEREDRGHPFLRSSEKFGKEAAMPVIEFIVEGTPVSHQTKNKPALTAWKAQVTAQAQAAYAGSPVKGSLQITIMNFYDGTQPPCDDDNMVKPIRDAMNKVLYDDDKQITHAHQTQTSNAAPFVIRGASKLVVDALQASKEFVYIKIEDAPALTALPR
jgi:crossover junction endodeoxyribonuclease RusA